MADTELQMVVAQMGRLMFSRAAIEWFSSDFDDHPESDLERIYERAVEEATVNITRERTHFASASVVPRQDANQNRAANLEVDEARLPRRWLASGPILNYNGSPERVRIQAMVVHRSTGRDQRAAPQLAVQRSNDGGESWQWTSTRSATGYTRGATGHNQASNTVSQTDIDPGDQPSYRLVFSEGSGERDSCPVIEGHFQLEALETDKLTLLRM